MQQNLLEEIYDRLIEGEAQQVKDLTEKALEKGYTPEVILQKSLVAAIEVVGWRYRQDEIFVPDILMASRAMHAGLYVLRPYLSNSDRKYNITIILGTVAGDLHDIGKNYIGMMLKGAGFNVIDIGIDVPAEKFLEAIQEYRPEVVGMSALLTTTMAEIQTNIALLEEQDIRSQVKVIIGGAPVTKEFAEAVGADGYADDVFEAVELVKNLVGVS
ncbi:MAG: corrinoid protein [Bacillota bacterium]|nr:corrinoid protein [Bacillota bacterium]